MKKEPNLGCGPRIKKWRKGISMKSFQLAKLIKISQGSLSDIENSKSNPSALTIVKFINKTNINIMWMLTGKEGNIESGEMPKAPTPLTISLNKEGVNEVLVRVTD